MVDGMIRVMRRHHRDSVTTSIFLKCYYNYIQCIWHYERNSITEGCVVPWINRSLWPLDAYIRQLTNHHWFKPWLVAWSVPSHFLNQCWCWNIVEFTHAIWLHWHLLWLVYTTRCRYNAVISQLFVCHYIAITGYIGLKISPAIYKDCLGVPQYRPSPDWSHVRNPIIEIDERDWLGNWGNW